MYVDSNFGVGFVVCPSLISSPLAKPVAPRPPVVSFQCMLEEPLVCGAAHRGAVVPTGQSTA